MRISIALIVLFIFSACAKDDGTADTTVNATTTLTSNLESVSSTMVPDSLDYSASSIAFTTDDEGGGGNPCAAVDNDLFACQPVLLRLYLSVAKMFVDLTQGIIEDIGTNLGHLADGSSGTIEIAAEGLEVAYDKTSATEFSFLIKKEGTPAAYISVAGTVISLKMDLSTLEGSDSGAPGGFQIDLDYTDENTWNMTAFATGMQCSDDDARAPERIRIKISKADGLWRGKAQFYNGVWLYGASPGTQGDPSCAMTATDELSMNFYTDFVGNDAAAKASVYTLQRDIDDLTDIDTWSLAMMGENFLGSASTTSAYVNSFCNPASTLEATWDDDCSEVDADIAAADYSSATDWVAPLDFYQLEIEIPTSL